MARNSNIGFLAKMSFRSVSQHFICEINIFIRFALLLKLRYRMNLSAFYWIFAETGLIALSERLIIMVIFKRSSSLSVAAKRWRKKLWKLDYFLLINSFLWAVFQNIFLLRIWLAFVCMKVWNKLYLNLFMSSLFVPAITP